MKTFLNLFSFVLFSSIFSSLSWAGPLVVGKGAGEAEYALIFTRSYLPQLLSQCLSPCRLTAEESSILRTLIRAAKTVPEVEFIDAKDKRVFNYDENKDIVSFNRNELWQDLKKSQPINELIATKLWIQVLAQQQKIYQETLNIQNELEKILSKKFIATSLSVGLKHNFQALLWLRSNGRLFVRDGTYTSYDLTAQLLEATECKTAKEIQFFSQRWEEAIRNADGSYQLVMSITQSWRCDNQAERGRMRLILKALAPDYQMELNSILVYKEAD